MSVERPIEARSPDVSVVVATVPGSDTERLVSHLERQRTAHGFEVVLVENASIDRSRARNRGIRAARAPTVALTDDDTVPPPTWVEAVADHFAENPGRVAVEGAVDGAITYRGRGQYVGCNLAVSREAALAVGGFDPGFAGWREDTEFGWRLEREADGSTGYSGAIRLEHPDRTRSEFDPRLERRLYRTYPERYERYHSGVTLLWQRLDSPVVRRLEAAGTRCGLVQRIHRSSTRVQHARARLGELVR
jgi:GT2 family glycosyltransferase